MGLLNVGIAPLEALTDEVVVRSLLEQRPKTLMTSQDFVDDMKPMGASIYATKISLHLPRSPFFVSTVLIC
ncbi:hypothetical protein CsSME_00023113 [Camellia sinensis var. sinensis]